MKHTVELIELPSGAKGLLIDVPGASVVAFDFNFRAGDYLAPADKWDTAHLMEHLALGANAKYKKSRDYSREYSKNGAYNNASTGTYHMSYVGECAEFEAERITDLLCTAIESPLFLKQEFDAELQNVREELKSRRNSHSTELSLMAGKAMGMLDLPYTEREKMLNNITLDDVKKHYHETHTLANLRFFVAGAVNKHRQAIVDRIAKLDLPKGTKRIGLPIEKLRDVPETIIIPDKAVENVYYRWETGLDHLLTDEQSLYVDALHGILLSTMHSRIFGAARERGLVYGIGYGKYRTRDNHLWWVGGQMLPENSVELFNLIAGELKSVAQGNFTEDELADGKAYALGTFQRSYQTVGSILDEYVESFIFNDRIEDFSHIPDKIEAVTTQDVIDTAKMCLKYGLPWSLSFYGATDQIDAAKLRQIIANSYL